MNILVGIAKTTQVNKNRTVFSCLKVIAVLGRGAMRAGMSFMAKDNEYEYLVEPPNWTWLGLI